MSMAMSRCFARMPSLAHTVRLGDHGAGVLRNALAMERRLRHLALLAMLRAFGGDHAFAQQHLRAPHGAFFDEIVVLHHQHFADVVRMIQEDDVIPSDLVVRDVAVGVGQVLEQQDGIRGAKPAEGKPEEITLEAGREAVSRVLAAPPMLFPTAVAILIVYVAKAEGGRSG